MNKRNKNSKGKRSFSKPRNQGSSRDDRNRRTSYKEESDNKDSRFQAGENDISWYSRNPNLLLAAGSFPYPYRPGMVMNLGNYGTDNLTETLSTTNRTYRIPGAATILWAPSLGVSNLATDPASVAAKEIYARVRAAFSGDLKIDAPDFIMYLMSLDSVYSYIAWLKRLYRTLSVWTPDNYALPDVVLSAMQISVPEALALRSDKTHLWQVINQLVLQSRKFTCPATMDIFNRHYWMSDNVYMDAASIASQMYVFNPYCVYQFAELAVDTEGNVASGLKPVKLPVYASNGNITVDSLYNFGRDLIDALVAWDEAYTINGYLMKAYESTPQFVVEELRSDEMLTPIYSEEVLTQIENMRSVAGNTHLVGGVSGFAVKQDPKTNAVISNPSISFVNWTNDRYNELKWDGNQLACMVSLRSMTPTVADTTIATRMQAITSWSGDASRGVTVSIQCGTEIPLGLYYIDTAAASRSNIPYGIYVPQVPVLDLSDATNWLNYFLVYASGLEQFDWHPFIWLTVQQGTSTKARIFMPMGDTHNITSISQDALANLHKVCLYSEFNAFNQ